MNTLFGNFEDFEDDTFEVTKDGIEKLQKFKDGDFSEETEYVIDDGAEDEEDLEDSYIGKIILRCPVCKSLILKPFGEVSVDEGEEFVNIGCECPYCYGVDGFKVLGQVAVIDRANGENEEDEVEEEKEEREEITESTRRDDIDAEADNKKELAKKRFMRRKDDADADRDYKLKKAGLNESAWDKIKPFLKSEKVEEGCDKKELKESPIYGLNPVHDSRKSFGGKAQVDIQKGEETLYSYDTPVVRIKDEKVTLLPKWDFSATTLRHVKEFLKQHGFKAETRNQIAADYTSEMEEGCHSKKSIKESDAPAATSIEEAQKWVDYDMKKYGEISKKTNRLIRKAGFQIVKDEYGDYEVIAGKYDESLKEDFKDVTITTDDSHMEMRSEKDGKVVVTTEPVRKDDKGNTEDIIVPIDDKSAEELTEEDKDKEVSLDVDEFAEEDFDELGESYLKEVYDNVKSYKTTSAKIDGNKMILDGKIHFTSGKVAPTKFLFEGKVITKKGKVKLVGGNDKFSKNKKAFTLTGAIKDKKLLSESLTYNYRGVDGTTNKSKRIYGTVKKSK